MKNYFLIIRYGNLDKVDPIIELEKILHKRGFAWFGKYGQPVSYGLIENCAKKGTNKVFVVLVSRKSGKVREKTGYVYHFYDLAETARVRPKGDYPEYYRKFLFRIKSWLKLKKYTGPKIDLRDITSRSSGMSVTSTLMKSMRGHFMGLLRQ